MWTIGTTKNYVEGMAHDNDFIKKPDKEPWDAWYEKIREFRQAAHTNMYIYSAMII